METKLVIHCVGLEGLTITILGADHSMPMTTDVLRVTTLLGSIEYTLPQLPVTYDLADLNGNLNISDGSAEHRQPGNQSLYHLKSERRYPSDSAPPSCGTPETPPNSLSSKALNQLSDHQNASWDVEEMAEDLDRPCQLRSRNGHKVNYLLSKPSQTGSDSAGSYSESSPPVCTPKMSSKQKPKKPQRHPKERFYRSGDSDPEPLQSIIPSAGKRRHGMRTAVANKGDSGLDSLELGLAEPRKPRSKRREGIRLGDPSDRSSETPLLDMTCTRKIFLRNLIDCLLKENYAEPFAKPVDAVAQDIPTYHRVIKRAMDLGTLKENLDRDLYSAVEDFEADSNLIIENAIPTI